MHIVHLLVADDWQAATASFVPIGSPVSQEAVPNNTLVIFITATTDAQPQVDLLLKV